MFTDIPLVTVMMPVFNGQNTVISAIESIQKQTLPTWQMLILDDGSNDHSHRLCNEKAKQDHRISVFRHEQNLGLARSMNRLVSLAEGAYLAVQEQDDRSTPDRLEKEVLLLESKPEVGVVSGIATWVDQQNHLLAHFPGLLARGEQYPQDLQEMVRFLFVEQCKVVNAACMIRRSVTDQIQGPFDPEARMSIDWQFFLHAAHFTKFWGIPEVLIFMRRDQGHHHLTRNKELQFSEARRCIRLMYEKYRSDSASPINRDLFRKAMTTEMVLESKYYGRLRGLGLLGKAFAYGPITPQVYSLAAWYGKRLLQKIGMRK